MPDAAARHALLVSHYETAELHILQLIKEAVARGADGTATHYRNQHRDLQIILKKVRAELDHIEGTITKEMLDIALDDYKAAYAASVQQAAAVSPVAAGVNTAAVGMITEVQAIAAAGTAQVLSIHHQILRSTADAYQSVVASVAARAAVTGAANPALVQDAMNLLADKGITSFVDKSGRRWGIDTYTDMAVRTTRNNALNEGNIRGWEDAGLELVQGSWHPASAPQCVPFQRQLMAVKGEAGIRSVTNVLTGEVETVNVVDTLRGAIAKGWHHPNCRHSDSPYMHGISTPEPPAGWKDENDEQYKALQRQRAIERNIRHWKKREAVALTPEAQARARGKVKAWQGEMRAHIKAHDHLTRHSVREQVRAGRTGKTLAAKPPRKVTPKPAPTPAPAPPKPAPTPEPKPAPVPEAEPFKLPELSPMELMLRKMAWDNDAARVRPKGTAAARAMASTNRQDIYTHPEFALGNPVTPDRATARAYRTLEDIPLTDRTTWGGIKLNTNPERRKGIETGNCVRVVQAVEMRKRGYDVIAASEMYPHWSPLDKVDGTFLAAMELGNSKGVDNIYRALMSGWETPEGLKRLPVSAGEAIGDLSVNETTVKIMEASVPEGARGFATCKWAGSVDSGHTWNWVKEDGEIKFFDAQDYSGFIDRSVYLKDAEAESLAMIRMDDMVPLDEVLHSLRRGYTRKND